MKTEGGCEGVSVCEGVCVCLRIFSCETSITGAVNYEQFVQLLNWRDHPLSQEGRPKVQDHNGYWPAVRYLIYLLLHNLTHYHITGRHRVQCFVEWRPALPWSPLSTTAPCSLTWQCTVADQHSRIKQTCVYTALRLRN